MPRKQTASPTKKLVPLMTRLPESLHSWIREQAQAEHRSVNSQIIVILQRAMEQQDRVANQP